MTKGKTELQMLSQEAFKDVRTIEKDGDTWFIAKDVCAVLGIKNTSTALRAVNKEDKNTIFLGYGSPANAVNEAGIYAIMLKSRKSQARHWITNEVLPSLIKHGKYEVKEAEIVQDTDLPQDNALQVFNHEAFGDVRVIEKDGEPWFVAKDVCEVLGIKDVSMATSVLDEDELRTSKVGTNRGKRITSLVNESGLYTLVIRSNKPQAKPFRKWVTSEVLPSIRKTGGYLHTSADDTPEVIMAKALFVADATIKQTKAELKEAYNKIEQDAPKVAFAEQVEGSEDSVHVAILAKLLKQNGFNIGRDRLFALLRADGFLIKEGLEKNLPTQRSMNAGYMEIKETTSFSPHKGCYFLNKTTLITGKGQRYFLHKYLKNN